MGCLGLSVLAAIAVVAVTTILLAGRREEVAEPTTDPQPATVAGKVRSPRAGPVFPTVLAADSAKLPLPGSVSRVTYGSNGRFLLIQTPGQILVFDPNVATFLQPFPIDDPTATFAASATKLFVHHKGRLERYHLVSRAMEAAVPYAKPVAGLAVGAGVDQPLFVFTTQDDATDVAVLDAESLQPRAGAIGSRFPQFVPRVGRCCFDGNRIGLCLPVPPADSPFSSFGPVLRFDASNTVQYEKMQLPNISGHVTPSPNGKFVYSSFGVFSYTGKHLLQPDQEGSYFYTLPPAQGNDFFLSLRVNAAGIVQRQVRLHHAGVGDRDPVKAHFAEIPGVVGPVGALADDVRSPLTAEDRVHFWPAAGIIAVIPPLTPQGKQPPLEISRVELHDLLDRATIPLGYPIILSDPPLEVRRGERWMYPLAVWSSRVRQRYEVRFGPPGMQLMAADRPIIEWDVPRDYGLNHANVIIRVSDTDVRLAEQFFRVDVLESERR